MEILNKHDIKEELPAFTVSATFKEEAKERKC